LNRKRLVLAGESRELNVFCKYRFEGCRKEGFFDVVRAGWIGFAVAPPVGIGIFRMKGWAGWAGWIGDG